MIELNPQNFANLIMGIRASSGAKDQTLRLSGAFTQDQLLALRDALEVNNNITEISVDTSFRQLPYTAMENILSFFLFLETNRTVKAIGFDNPSGNESPFGILALRMDDQTNTFIDYGVETLREYIDKKTLNNTFIADKKDAIRDLVKFNQAIYDDPSEAELTVKLKTLKINLAGMQRCVNFIIQHGGIDCLERSFDASFMAEQRHKYLEFLCKYKDQLLWPELKELLGSCKSIVQGRFFYAPIFTHPELTKSRKKIINTIESSWKNENNPYKILSSLLAGRAMAKSSYDKFGRTYTDSFTQELDKWLRKILLRDEDLFWLESKVVSTSLSMQSSVQA